MNNYKTRLEEQAKALQLDIENLITNVKNQEIILDEMRFEKSKAQRELRSIEKRLAKIEGK